MLRRDFIKLMTGIGVISYSSPVMAQSIDKVSLNSLGDKFSNLWEKNVELDVIPEEQPFFEENISIDQSCTFSESAIHLTIYQT